MRDGGMGNGVGFAEEDTEMRIETHWELLALPTAPPCYHWLLNLLVPLSAQSDIDIPFLV